MRRGPVTWLDLLCWALALVLVLFAVAVGIACIFVALMHLR